MLSATLVEPDFHTAPAYAETLGPEVADLCAEVGFAPYPEQAMLLDDAFALSPSRPGRSAAFEVAALVARQNLKTGFFIQCALGWLFITDQELTVWSAHEFSTSQESFRKIDAILAGSPMLSKRVRRVYQGNGNESVELKNGNRLIFKARTHSGGRGLTGNKIILDEAFALMPEHMGALLPTLLAVEDPQVMYGSSAGMLKSAILRGIRDRGRVGADRLAYAEWFSQRRECAGEFCGHLAGTPGCAMDDRDLWRSANPIHARKDPELVAVKALRGSLTPQEFARECLTWWEDPEDDGASLVGPWGACKAQPAQVSGPLVLAVETTLDRSQAVLVVVGSREDGRPQVEMVPRCRPDCGHAGHGKGVSWVARRVAEVVVENGVDAVVVGGSSPSLPLVDPIDAALEAAGSDVRVTVAKGADVPEACGQMWDSIDAGDLAHLDDPMLNAAVRGAERKDVGDSWVWSRREGGPVIAPLYGGSFALWKWRELAAAEYDVMESVW